MDARLQDILKSLATMVNVLDEELMRMERNEQFQPNEQCLRLLLKVEGSCLSTLETVESLRKKLASSAFIIPPEMMRALEQE